MGAEGGAKDVIVYRTAAPLTAGHYTFTAYAQDLGIWLGGFEANGGETLFEMPAAPLGYFHENPRIKLGGITVDRPTDFCDLDARDALLRGDAVKEDA